VNLINSVLSVSIAVGMLLLLWKLVRAVENLRRMLYALLTRNDGRPQVGESVLCANGKLAEVLWRKWSGAEECASVHYRDGGLDMIYLDTLEPVRLSGKTERENSPRGGGMR